MICSGFHLLQPTMSRPPVINPFWMKRSPFLKAEPLKPEETERYSQYESTTEDYSLYEHCRRALVKGSTAGIHGLPLMGAGDWNDGMNRVGAEGRGESVWLGWFLYATLKRFATLCELMKDDPKPYTPAGGTIYPRRWKPMPGMETGICAPSTMMAPAWDRVKTTNVRSIPSRNPGLSYRVRADPVRAQQAMESVNE